MKLTQRFGPIPLTTTLNGSGGGTVTFQSNGSNARITNLFVKVSTATAQATCTIYKGQVADGNAVNTTNSGSTGATASGAIDLTDGETLYVVWRGGDAGATATATFTGITIPFDQVGPSALEWADPIAAGDGSLIYPALKSPNFVAGSTGWRIDRDGDAEFNAIDVRGSGVFGSPTGVRIELTSTGALKIYNASNVLIATIDANGILLTSPATGDFLLLTTDGGLDGPVIEFNSKGGVGNSALIHGNEMNVPSAGTGIALETTGYANTVTTSTDTRGVCRVGTDYNAMGPYAYDVSQWQGGYLQTDDDLGVLGYSVAGGLTDYVRVESGIVTIGTTSLTGTGTGAMKNPIVRLTQQAAQSIPNNTNTSATFGAGSEDIDTHNFHSTTVNTERITPTIPGYYYLTGTYVTSARNDYNNVGCVISKNGSAAGAWARAGENTFSVVKTRFCDAILAANGSTDYFELTVYQINAAAVAANSGTGAGFSTTFNCMYLRPL